MENSQNRKQTDPPDPETFVEGIDFYFEDGKMVLTRHYLANRGYCCGNGCRHCPYEGDEKRELQ